MNIKSVFGENLKFYRRAKHLSQEQLSEKVDISVKHLSSIERGLTFVSSDLLERLAFSIEVPIFCLFVNEKRISYNEVILNTVEKIIKKHLVQTIEEIKSDINQNNHQFSKSLLDHFHKTDA